MIVYPIGATVKFKNANINGHISKVMITQNNSVMYEISYFKDGEAVYTFHYDFEFTITSDDVNMTEIGFYA